MEDIVTIDQANRAHEVFQRMIELNNQLGYSFLELARTLKDFKEARMYVALGYESFKASLAAPELALTESTAYKLIRVYETWFLKYALPLEEIAQVPYDKLILVSPLVTDENHEEIFNKAKSLSRRDLMELKRDKDLNENFPDHLTPPTFWRCKDCGKWRTDMQPKETCICTQPY